MKIITHAILVACIALSMSSKAEELPHSYTLSRSMDFDWERLCTSVKSISFQGCDVVHPASPMLRNWGDPYRSVEHDTADARRWALDCESTKRNFKKYTTKGLSIDKPWLHCKTIFESSYSSRFINHKDVKAGKTVPHYEQDIVSWYDQYMKPYLK